MNVCLIKLNGWPDSFDERIYSLAKNLDSLTIIRPKPNNYDSSLEDLENVSIYELLPSRSESIDAVWIHPFLFPIYVLQAIVVVSYLILNPRKYVDVVHSVDYIVNGITAAILSIIWNIPTVVSVRGLTEFRYKNHLERSPSRIGRINLRLVRAIPAVVFKQADHIITKSEYQVGFIEDNYETVAGFSVIPTGVDFSKFNLEEQYLHGDDIAEFLDTPPHMFGGTTILHLGKLTENKGINELLWLIQQSDDQLEQDIRFICVGRTRNESFKKEILELEERIDRLFVYPDQIPFELVPLLLDRVNGLILLSEAGHEGTPRVLQESYAMGTPVIASDVTGIKGAFSEIDGAILIDRENPNEFQNAVKLIANREIEVDRSDARANFDMETNYAKYAGIYQSVVFKRSERDDSPD